MLILYPSPRPSPPSRAPASKPLMPAIRPLRAISRLAARPINAPPASADQGVKCNQSMLIQTSFAQNSW